MQNNSIDFTLYDNTLKRFRCDKCHRKWPPLKENATGFSCICGNRKPKYFWAKRFKDAPSEMTLRQASQIIGADILGSTMRQAIRHKRLTPKGKLIRQNGLPSKREYLITLPELIRYYLEDFNHRHYTKKESLHGNSKSKSTTRTK